MLDGILEAGDVAGWTRDQVDRELRARLDDVNGYRERNGGTLEGLAGDDADRVTSHMRSLNALGARRDELDEQANGDRTFDRLNAFLNEPGAAPPMPGSSGATAPAGVRPIGQASDVGALFAASDALAQYVERGALGIPARVPTASIFGGSFAGIGEIPSAGPGGVNATLFDSTGFATRREFRDDALVDVYYQPNNIAALMPQGTTDSDTITYPVETVTATGAAEVAEGSTKPEAQLAFADTDEPLRTIAVLLPVTNRALRNTAFLRAYINARLRLFVEMREDSQLLVGNGTAPNLRGILNRSGTNTATSYSIGGANPDQAFIDSLFKAAMRVRDSYLEPDAIVTKPSTWELARLAKDGNRNYILGPPADNAPMRAWGLPVVLNANMPAQVAANKVAIVGAFRTSAMVVRRDGVTLALSESHSTFFAENKVMLRAEEEVAFCVFRPAGFAIVTSAA